MVFSSEISDKRVWSPAMQIEALACASASMTSTELPSAARASASATTVVVLPTPPFMLATAMTFPVTHLSQPTLRLHAAPDYYSGASLQGEVERRKNRGFL